MLGRVSTYLSFLEHARCSVRGFHNFLSYRREWLDAEGAGDSQGQAVLALAELLGGRLPDGYRAVGPRVDRIGHAHAGRSAEPTGAGLRDFGLGATVDLGSEGYRAARDGRLVRGATAGGVLPPLPWAGLALVRVAHGLRECRVAARHVRRGPVLAGGISSTSPRRRSISWIRETTERTSSGRWETATGIHAEEKIRCTISSRSRRPPWPTPHWPASPRRATRSIWRRSAGRTLGFTAAIAYSCRLSMCRTAPAMTVCSRRA